MCLVGLSGPPNPSRHPILYLALSSPRQGAENHHLQPTGALLPAPGTLHQLLWVLLPGWEGRVQRGGPPDKPEECACWQEVARPSSAPLS